MIQRIIYTNKAGEVMDLTLDILGKYSKWVKVRNPEDGTISNIPRQAVEEISEPVKTEEEK